MEQATAGWAVIISAVRRVNRLPHWVMLVWLALAPDLRCAAAQTPTAPAAIADDDAFEDLLHKTERQISAGHVVAPTEDSALETWSLILQHEAALPHSAAIRRDLVEFASSARSRAANEKSAGRVSVAIDFTVFADLASQLLTHMAEPQSSETPATPPPPPVAAAPPPSESAAIVPPLAPPPPPAAPSVLPSPPPANVTDSAAAEFYFRRGDEMLAAKDVSAARKFYEFAANAGSGRAASALARTHEPGALAKLGVVGVKPDPGLAKFWYSRAAALGDPGAQAKLQELGTAAAK